MPAPKNPNVAAADFRWRKRTVLEYVDEAIAQAGAEEYATPDAALRWLLQCAWEDLQTAREQARNGRWSMECDDAVARIVGLTRLVGPLSSECVPDDVIRDGIYEQIHEAIGTPPHPGGGSGMETKAKDLSKAGWLVMSPEEVDALLSHDDGWVSPFLRGYVSVDRRRNEPRNGEAS